MTSESPIVDLSSLPIELQAIECYDRLQRGKSHPNAVKVCFYMNNFAQQVAVYNFYNGSFFLAS